MPTGLFFHHHMFELNVREALNRPDGPISAEEVAGITELFCNDFDFDPDDLDTLKMFVNLESLSIHIGNIDLSFFSAFQKLRTFSLFYWSDQYVIDFSGFADMPVLETLYVCGGDISSINLINLTALESCKHLKKLCLIEFGTVDLSFLKHMPSLESFICGYGDQVKGIESIGMLPKLRRLELDQIEIENLDFLDSLPDELTLDLCACEVHEGIDLKKMQRFSKLALCDMTVNGKPVTGMSLTRIE